jgi:hypothetical protein
VRDSADLVQSLERWLPRCHGTLFDAWIDHLLEDDQSSHVDDYVQGFVASTAAGANGLEKRFAKKFGILCAAGRLGVESGLLPWPDDWPMRAVRHCYENSLEERDPDVAEATEGVRQLAANLNSKERFPRVAAQRGRNPKWSDGQIGLHRFDGRKWETLLARDRLHHLCGDCTSESAVFQRLLGLEVVKQGEYSSASEQLRVRSPDGDVKRVRFWKVDVGKLRQWAKQVRPLG